MLDNYGYNGYGYKNYDLDAEIRKENIRYRKYKTLNSRRSYNEVAYGSAECGSASWDGIFDAYNEYKRNNEDY